jgi:sterol desaturase/sphingolipid hydroxylase (fatty acid hydroxylase superfamily)
MHLFEVMTWLDVVELVGYLVLPVFLVADLIWHDRVFQAPKFWRGRAALVTAVAFYGSIYVAQFWGRVFESKSLLNGAALGTFGGALAGILIYELAHYGYHRLAHEWDPLWRLTHQMHHSAESVDAFGAFYIHPLDNAAFTTLGSLVFFPILGLSLEAGLLASVFLTVNAVFQHANIRTPRWLGYLIQRPESHRIHHARGIHGYNYSDLPLWDIVFRTFRNPADEGAKLGGFYNFASTRIWDMLVFRDVSQPKLAAQKMAPREQLAKVA